MKKEIMIFINTLEGGGAEKALANFLKVFKGEKYNFTLLTVSGGERIGDIPEGVTVKKAANFRIGFLNRLFVRILHHIPYRLAAKLCIKGKYDIEIAYLEGFPTRVIAARKSDAKKIAFVHGTVTDGSESLSLYRSKEECLKVYNSFDRVCFVSKDTKKAFESSVGELNNSSVVYNIFDVDEIKNGSNQACDIKYRHDRFKMIAVGSFLNVKGFDRLLRISKKLEKEYSFELWIIGKGPLRQEFEGYIEREGIKSVKLLDFDKNPYKYMKQADLLVCSSLSEGYSTVAVEALILGIPVLTCKCSGMEEITKNGKYGLIVENSEDALFDGLEKILSDKELYENLKKNAMLFETEFSNNAAIDGYIGIFE